MNVTEILEIDTHKYYSQVIFDKEPQIIQWIKDSLLKELYGITVHPYTKKKSKFRSSTLHKNNSKWMMELNVKCKTVNPVDNDIGEKHLGPQI